MDGPLDVVPGREAGWRRTPRHVRGSTYARDRSTGRATFRRFARVTGNCPVRLPAAGDLFARWGSTRAVRLGHDGLPAPRHRYDGLRSPAHATVDAASDDEGLEHQADGPPREPEGLAGGREHLQ